MSDDATDESDELHWMEPRSREIECSMELDLSEMSDEDLMKLAGLLGRPIVTEMDVSEDE